MTITSKINKPKKPGGPQGNFCALFGRSPAFFGHFRVDAVTSECSTRISSSDPQSCNFTKKETSTQLVSSEI